MISSNKIIVDFLRRNWILTVIILLIVVFNSVLNILIPLSIGKFYELVLHDEGSSKGRLLDQLGIQVESVRLYFEFFIGLLILKTLLTFSEYALSGFVSEKFAKELREKLFQSQLRQPVKSFEKKPVGKYLLRYGGDLSALQKLVTRGIITFSGDVLFLLLTLLLLYKVNAQLSLIFFTGIPIAGVIMYLFKGGLQRRSLQKRNQRSSLLAFVSSRFQAFLTIKSFNRETPEEAHFNRKSERLFRYNVRYHGFHAVMQAMIPFLFFVMLGMVLYTSATSDVSGAEVFVFVLLTLYLRSVVKRILNVSTIWQQGGISLQKLMTIFNDSAEPRSHEMAIGKTEGRIQFNNVSFSYSDGKPLFQHLTFSADPSSITLIRGKQGSGKSTLLKLILRIYEQQEGDILLDNINFKNLSPFQIRKNVTIVSDEMPLLGDTVFRAVSYSRDEEKKTQVIRVLEQLKFSISGYPEDDLDAKIGEQGKQLSSGQQKLLRIARAFSTRKKVILLDEPFDDLDEEATGNLVKVINSLRKKRTVIMISSRQPKELFIDKTIDLLEKPVEVLEIS